MKAAVYERYGPPEVVAVRDVAIPVPRVGEVRIRVHAATVTSGDWRARTLDVPAGFGLPTRLFFGVTGPRQRILGSEAAGVVDAVGDGVHGLSPGDEVFAFADAGMGCHAEYVCLPARKVVHKPLGLGFGEAAALSFGGTTAMDFLRRGRLATGERVLVNGASGGVGTAVVQLARHQGAIVSAVCSESNVDLVRSLGAQRVFDYSREDFTRSGERYDIVVDIAGTAPFSRCQGSLAAGGRLLVVLGTLAEMLRIPWVHATTDKRVVAGPASGTHADLSALAELAGCGAMAPVIDRRYPLDRIVEAHRYVETGHKRGNVVIDVISD